MQKALSYEGLSIGVNKTGQEARAVEDSKISKQVVASKVIRKDSLE